ncbi:MAG: hypothetical protein ACRERE_24200 [Candidatus Entotheonellia bacterium]
MAKAKYDGKGSRHKLIGAERSSVPVHKPSVAAKAIILSLSFHAVSSLTTAFQVVFLTLRSTQQILDSISQDNGAAVGRSAAAFLRSS